MSGVDPRVSRIVDLKTPGSGECAKNHWDNLAALNARAEITFVLRDEADYLWARQVIAERKLDRVCPVLVSPSHGELAPAALAAWVLRDRLPVRVQLQLHKTIWGDVPGR